MRGKQARKRVALPDSKYSSVVVSKFINNVMKEGKKDLATKMVYEAIDVLAKESKIDPMDAFVQAIENIKPKVEVRSRRVGGANYQVPVPVSEERQQALAFRWIIKAARESRKTGTFAKQLGITLAQALKKEGAAYKKREDTHKMADANKAFAQFAW